MKYILNENIKFILDERFVLNEAVSAADWDTPINNALSLLTGPNFDNTAIDELKNKIAALDTKNNIVNINGTDKNLEDIIQELNTKKDEAESAFADTFDLTILTGKVQAYLNIIKPFVEDPNIAQISKGLKKLVQAVENRIPADLSDTTKRAEIESAELEKAFNALTNAVSLIVRKTKSNTTNDVLKKIENLTKAISDAIDRLNTLKAFNTDDKKTIQIQNILKLFSGQPEGEILKYKDLEHTLDEPPQQLITNQNLVDGIIDGFLSGLTSTLTTFVSEIDAELKFNDYRDASVSGQAKKPWMELLRQAVDSQEKRMSIWADYYKTEWGELADKVKGLGEAFTKELVNLGFSANVNPFIIFVKENITKLNLNKDNYAAIHNAYVYGYIDKKALRREKMDELSPEANILFNKNLYTKAPAMILKYLSLQSQLVNKYTPKGEATIKNTVFQKLYSKNCNVANVIILTKTKSFLDRPEPASISINVENSILRTLEEASSEYRILFDEEASSAKTAKSNINIAAIWEALGKQQKYAINAIKYLVANYDTESLKLDDLANQYKEIRAAGPGFDITLSTKYKNIFDRYNIDNSNIRDLITGLAEEAAKFTKG